MYGNRGCRNVHKIPNFMKKLFIISVLAFACGGAAAMGPVGFGVKAGVNAANFKLAKTSFGENVRAFGGGRTGYHAGVFTRFDFLNFSVQPELLYNVNRYDLELQQAGSVGKGKVRIQTLEMPVMAGFSLLFLRLQAGPVFNLANKSSDLSGQRIHMGEMTKPTISYSTGVGLDIFKFTLDVRYNGMFERKKQFVEFDGGSHEFKGNFDGWTFGVGYRF